MTLNLSVAKSLHNAAVPRLTLEPCAEKKQSNIQSFQWDLGVGTAYLSKWQDCLTKEAGFKVIQQHTKYVQKQYKYTTLVQHLVLRTVCMALYKFDFLDANGNMEQRGYYCCVTFPKL